MSFYVLSRVQALSVYLLIMYFSYSNPENQLSLTLFYNMHINTQEKQLIPRARIHAFKFWNTLSMYNTL